MPGFSDHALAVVITVGMPAYALFVWHRRLLRAVPANRHRVRMETYRNGILIPWAVTLLTLIHWGRSGRPWPDLGVGLETGLGFWTGLALAGAVFAFASWQRLSLHEEPRAEEEVAHQIGNLEPLLPRTPGEMRWFLGVSLTAGVCEELLFRGFLLWYLSELVATGAAVVLASLLFGMAHAYQGTRGILQTGGVGLVLAGVVLLTGSVWVSIAIHAFIDVNSGLLAYNVLRRRESPE